MSEPIQVISLGAGVQSSTMALMAAHGEITPMPKSAIFADTQDEPSSVYRWLDWLEKELPFPVHRVTAGRLSERATKMRISKKGLVYTKTDLPYFTLSAAGEQGMVPHRACTSDFKLAPLMRKARQEAGIKRGQRTVGVIQWIGISLDEATRMKPGRDAWAQSRWPLIELRMKRQDCLRWMRDKGYPTPPRSACVFCPFHSDAEWRRLKTDEPESFERAVLESKALTENIRSRLFLHRSCVPLDQVDFSSEEERGQLNMFENECEGMCGV